MATRELTEGERKLLSAALMHQARLERSFPLSHDIQQKLLSEDREESVEIFEEWISRAEKREDFFEFFATLILRGNLVVSSPIIIGAQA